jgi:cytochrome c oxidase cbb3-type subunit IV
MNTTTYGIVAGLATLISMSAFIGVVVWAMSRRRHSDFADAAQLPLEEDNGTQGVQS